MTQTEPLPDDGVLAAELALGVLEGAELAEALRRQIADPDFARQVERWRDHFALLALEGAEAAPPEWVAERVSKAVRDGKFTVGPIAFGRRTLRWWKAAALASGAIAATLAAMLVMRPAPPAQISAPQLVAALNVPEGHGTLLASLDGGRRLHIAGQLSVPSQHDAQLWLIVGKSAPRSLGVLHGDVADRLETSAPATMAVRPGFVLAISIEPLGGSPTGLPTGPVVASGVVQAI